MAGETLLRKGPVRSRERGPRARGLQHKGWGAWEEGAGTGSSAGPQEAVAAKEELKKAAGEKESEN